jgi:uncharacterized protein YhaN
MRIRRLDLVRYGRFTDEQLDLPPVAPDIHIVFGPNEAGKSTVLGALEDLLFGIPARSPMNFLHAYRSMRVGATLEANGDRLEIRRRKGNKNTILTPDDTPIAQGERVLMPFLANANREFFQRMFNLDHRRLRQGGREILDDRNEVGQVLFSASSGIQDLRGRLQALDAEADHLWAKRRSAKRRFYQADDRLKAAECQLREHLVSAAKWEDLKRRFESRREDYRRLETEVLGKDAELRKLGRIRRVARYIHNKSRLEAVLADLSDVADLPTEARETLRKAEQDLRLAARRLDEQQSELVVIRKEQAALTWNEALLLRKEDIDRLHEQRIQVQGERSDLPKRLRDLASAEEKIRDSAVDLGWEHQDISALVDRIPNRTKADHARALLNRRENRIAAVEAAEIALEDTRLRLSELMQQLEAIGTPKDVSRLEAIISATNRDIGADLRSAQNEAAEANADLERQFSDLLPRPSTVEYADSMTVPARGAVEAHRDNRRELDQRMRDCKQRKLSAELDLARRIKIRNQFVAEERPVSPGDVNLLRQKRDAGWSLVRRRYVDAGVVPRAELQAFIEEHESLASAYEASVETADRAADRRVETAEAAARLAELNRSIAGGEYAADALREEWSNLSKKSVALGRRWDELWREVPFEPLGPDEMLRWLDVHTGLRAAVNRRAITQRRVVALHRQEAAAAQRVRSELEAVEVASVPPPEHGLRVMVICAEQVHQRHRQAKEAKQKLFIDLRRAESEVEAKRKTLARAKGARAEWLTRWLAAVAELGLDAESSPEVISHQIGLIDQMRVSASKVTDLRVNRVEKIRRDIEDFRREARQVFQAVARDLAGTDPFDAVPELERRLASDSQIRRDAKTKDKEITARQVRLRKLEREASEARAKIQDLQALAGVEDIDALRQEIERAERSKAYESELSKAIEVLEQQGDGLSIEDLEAECAGVDLDEAASRETAVDEEIAELRKRQLEARDRLRIAREQFERIGGSDGAAVAESARQEALAEIQDVAERYVRTRTAALLLQWAVDRHRREKQAPMLRKASQLFGDLTLGSFAKLELDFDDDRPRLVGCRPSGERVQVSGMSDGSVDQLYLALRVAALEDYLEEAQPLPFVADDLFINFDDERAAAGLRVLGRLAKRCQVIFFTHHDHLVEVARGALPRTAPVSRMPQ